MEWDAFISHASEDKEAFVRPLANILKARGLNVWYDEFSLKIGDSLRRSIENGLSQSRFGIVVLSPHFFRKEWTKRELDALFAREDDGSKVILPIWHDVTRNDVAAHSLLLADRVAIKSTIGLEKVAETLIELIQLPDPALIEQVEAQSSGPVSVGQYGIAKVDLFSDDLIAVGPNVVCTGRLVSVGGDGWTLQIKSFIEGGLPSLISFTEKFNELKEDSRYLLVNALGDGRVLRSAPSIEERDGGYSIHCSIEPSFPRTPVQKLGGDFALSEETDDLFVKDGAIARVAGLDALPQKIRSVFSMIRGESPFHPRFGSRLQRIYWSYAASPLLNARMKLEAIRLAAIPYFDEMQKRRYLPLHCVERVWDVRPLAKQPDGGWLPTLVSLDVKGLGQWDRQVKVVMPPVEKLDELTSRERWKDIRAAFPNWEDE